MAVPRRARRRVILAREIEERVVEVEELDVYVEILRASAGIDGDLVHGCLAPLGRFEPEVVYRVISRADWHDDH